MGLTYNEIHDTFPSLNESALLINADSESVKSLFASNDRSIIFVGCGSSFSIAQSMASITQTMLNRSSFAVAGGDLLIHKHSYAKCIDGAIMVAISRSGSTSEIAMAIEQLRSIGCTFDLVLFCCVSDSPISRMSNFTFEMPWAFDESVCQTRSVTCLHFSCALLLANIAGNKQLIADLQKTINGGNAYLVKIEPILEQIANLEWSHAVVLGDAEISGISQEGSLTYKEICQLPSNFYNILDSRHGPIVLFNSKTLVVIAATSPNNEMEIELIKDVVRKGSVVVVYCDTPLVIEGTTNISFGEELSHVARGIPFILANQLISFFKSRQTGANPDFPDGLDPWIKI